jgi:hypothetical protein
MGVGCFVLIAVPVLGACAVLLGGQGGALGSGGGRNMEATPGQVVHYQRLPHNRFGWGWWRHLLLLFGMRPACHFASLPFGEVG